MTIPNFKFEQLTVYEGLIMIRERTINRVIGYVHKHPYDGGWFWFADATISELFNSIDDATADLIYKFTMRKMDQIAAKVPDIIVNK